MANPSAIDSSPAVIEATSSADSVTLQAGRSYSIAHNGVDTSGGFDDATIFLATSAAPTADYAAETDKVPLQAQRTVVLGPGVGTLYFRTASGSPTFTITPHRPLPPFATPSRY
jgi:hypothetical protein